MAQPQTEDVVAAIEALLLDDEGIGEIEAGLLGGFNMFEAIGHTRREERHSDFLAFLLDPNETHGLGANFLTRFVIEVVKATQPESRPLSLSKIALVDFTGCDVRREHSLGQSSRIDVLCIDQTHKFLLAIENKVDSGEGEDQLKKYRSFLENQYPDFQRVLAYLTPDNDQPSDESWTPAGYSDVLSIVETLAGKYRESLGEAVVVALDHYARMLRRHIVTDDKLVETAEAVYQKHKVALDFIFEQRPNNLRQIGEFAADLAKNDERIDVVRESQGLINFFPNAWKGISAFNATPNTEWTKTGHSLLFEIMNRANSISILLVIGPTEEEGIREKIYDFCHRNQQLFPSARKSLSNQYTRIYSKAMIDRNTLEKGSVEEIKKALESQFDDFMKKEFGKIVEVLAGAFAEAAAD